jgi:SAM-dependent methyltransferase
MLMLSFEQIVAGLELSSEGIWMAQHGEAIFYPPEARINCYKIEGESFWFRHRNACIQQVVKLFPPDGPIFDVGGGNGIVALYLMRNGIDVVMVEPGMEGCRIAMSRGVKQVICSTLESAGFPQGSLPGIGLFDVIEHIKDDVGFLKGVRRLLEPNGKLFVTVPAYQFLWSQRDINSLHFRRYTLRGLIRLLNSTGFQVEYGSYFFSFLPFPILARRTIPYHLQICNKSERSNKEHTLSRGLIGKMINQLLKYEVSRIGKMQSIPSGGSCIIAARRT